MFHGQFSQLIVPASWTHIEEEQDTKRRNVQTRIY